LQERLLIWGNEICHAFPNPGFDCTTQHRPGGRVGERNDAVLILDHDALAHDIDDPLVNALPTPQLFSKIRLVLQPYFGKSAFRR
jgi:hypothetical protein